jgi:hypothetical protein
MELPKPFVAKKLTNGNINEEISNFLLKNSVTIEYTGDIKKGKQEYFEKFKKKYPGYVDSVSYKAFCDKDRYFQILNITNSEIHFIPFKYLDYKCLYGIGDSFEIYNDSALNSEIKHRIKNDMLKEGYTFTSLGNGKYIEALKEIYIRTTNSC